MASEAISTPSLPARPSPFTAKVLDERLPVALDILSDMALRPAFREEDIEKEKGVVLEELKMDEDNPDYLIHEVFTSKFWKKSMGWGARSSARNPRFGPSRSRNCDGSSRAPFSRPTCS